MGFLDPPLHCNKVAAKVVGGKYLNELEKHVLEHNFIKFAALQPQLFHLQSRPSFTEFTVENKVWGSFCRITFESLDGNCNTVFALLHLSIYLHTSSK